MPGPYVALKGLRKKDREEAAAFVRRMIKLDMKGREKSARSRKDIEHHAETVVRMLDLAIQDENHYCTVATKGGAVIGIALGQVLGGVGRIDWMAVDPRHQRQGVGKRLMASAEERMKGRGCHKMTLFVVSSQMPALGLYLNWGMVPEATLKEHMWGDDHIVMSKWLEDDEPEED